MSLRATVDHCVVSATGGRRWVTLCLLILRLSTGVINSVVLAAGIRRQSLPVMGRIRPKLTVSVDDVRISRLGGATRVMLIDVVLQ